MNPGSSKRLELRFPCPAEWWGMCNIPEMPSEF